MKLKPSEVIILLFALTIGAAALFFQSIEPKINSHETKATEQPPETFFTDHQTVQEADLLAINPTQANQVVADFFNSLTILLKETPTNTTLIQTKNNLAQKTASEISDDPQIGTKELARFTGLLTAPQTISQIHTEQRSPEKIEITVQVTTTTDQTAEKTVILINEDNQWKIETITTDES